MTLNLSFFSLVAHAFSVTSKNQWPDPRLWNFTSSYIVLALTLMFIPHFELAFVYWYEAEVQLHFFYICISGCPTPFAEETVLSSSVLSQHSSFSKAYSENFTLVRYTSLWSYYFSNYQVFHYSTWTSKSLKQIYAIFILFQLGQFLTFKNIYQVPIIYQAVF